MRDSGAQHGDIEDLLARSERLSVAAWNKSLQLSLHRKRNIHDVIVYKTIRQHHGTGEIQRSGKEDIRVSDTINRGGSPSEADIQLSRIESSSDIEDRSRPARRRCAGRKRQISGFTSRIGGDGDVRTGNGKSNMTETGGRGPTGKEKRVSFR